MGTHCLDATVGERALSLATLRPPWEQSRPSRWGLAGLRGKLRPSTEGPYLPPTLFIWKARALETAALAEPSAAVTRGGWQHGPPSGRSGLGSTGLPANTLPLQSQRAETSTPSHTDYWRTSKTHTLQVLAQIRRHLHANQALPPALESVLRREAKPWAVVPP